MQYDNPAARLSAILEYGINQDRGKKCRDVWAVILKTGKNDSLLMSRIGKVMALPEEIYEKINFSIQPEPYDYWSNKVNTAFKVQNINGVWSTFIDHIDIHTINYLKSCSDILQLHLKFDLIDENKLSEIKKSITDVINDVTIDIDKDIDDEIKKYLVRTLQRIIVAIDEYMISGATPIMEAVEIAYGHAFIDNKYRNIVSKTEIGKKFISILNFTASAVTLALGYPQLSEGINQFLIDFIEN